MVLMEKKRGWEVWRRGSVYYAIRRKSPGFCFVRHSFKDANTVAFSALRAARKNGGSLTQYATKHD